MKNTLLIIVVLCAGIALGTAFNLGAGSALAQSETPGDWSTPAGPAPVSNAGVLPQGSGPNSAEPTSVDALPSSQMSYQGKLLQNGEPVSGTINITFSLYNELTGGAALWSETQSVNVQDGFFNVMLGAVTPIDVLDFYLQLYLGIKPAGASSDLMPRQKLGVSPYAFSLIPGATIFDTSAAGGYGAALYVRSDNHAGVFGSSGLVNSVGVRGEATGAWTTPGGPPVGVSGKSTNGYGVQGTSDNSTGVFGQGSLIGIWGQAARTYSSGVLGYGVNLTGTYGVHGTSAGYDGAGVYGSTSAAVDDCATSDSYCSAAIAGAAFGPDNDGAFGGFFYSAEASSVIGMSNATASYEGWFFNPTEYGPGRGGLYTNSDGRFDGNVFVEGTVTADNVTSIAVNSGSQPLRQGDVVVVVGYTNATQGTAPIIHVALADSTNASAIIGVVDVRYEPCTIPMDQRPVGQECGGFDYTATAIQPGEYLAVVTMGVASVRVNASSGPIYAGDLLTASGMPGLAATAQMITVDGASFYAPGTILGKALGDLETGSDLIPVFITIK